MYWGGGNHHNGARRPNARQSTCACTCKAHAGRCRARAHQWPAQAGVGHARVQALCRPTGLHCRTNSTARDAQTGERHWYVLTKGMQWNHPGKGTVRRLACRYQCRLSASTELATREMRPSKMVKNSPNERTVTRGEMCFSEATRVRKTVARTYPVPLAAPLVRCAPVLRGIAKLVMNLSF